jgi:hypothetical protein
MFYRISKQRKSRISPSGEKCTMRWIDDNIVGRPTDLPVSNRRSLRQVDLAHPLHVAFLTAM